MAKRTTFLAAVFAALLSVTLSVQADDTFDGTTMYWIGNAGQNEPLFFTGSLDQETSNWQDADGTLCLTRFISGASASALYTQNCYIYSTTENKPVIMDWGDMGVASVTIGDGVGTQTAYMQRRNQNQGAFTNLTVVTALTVQAGGSVESNGLTINQLNSVGGNVTITGGEYINRGSTSITNGSLNLSGGSYSTTGITIGSNGTFNYSGGTLDSGSAMTVAGTLNVSGGNFNATNDITVSEGGSFTYTAAEWDYANTLSVTGGSFTFNKSNSNFKVSKAINVSAGTFNVQAANSFRIGQSADATITISGGEFTSSAPTYVGINPYNGTITQSDGSATFNNELSIGWGNNTTGTYNLSGGTLTTTGKAGLCNYGSSKVNTFNMTGGTANFNQAGESFTIGMGSSSTTANAFNLYSGTVNAADTFAIKYGGTLNVAKNGETGGDGVLNAKTIALTNGGNLNMSSGTINVGEGGIASSDNAYSITLSGGTFGTNGSNWSSGLTATISADSAVTFSPDEGKSITWSGVLSGTGGVTKAGAGTLELTGANTYTGKTTVSGGILKLSGSGKLASTQIDVATGTTLLYDNTVPHNESPLTINVTGGTLEFYNTTVTDTHTTNNGICSGVAGQEVTINGTGATLLIDGGGTVSAIAGSGKSTITFALDHNSVFHVKNGYFINGGYATQDWTNNEAELRIGATGKVECWDGAKMQFGGLSGEAGAQLVNIKSGKGMVIGNGVTDDKSYTYNGIISLNGKNIDFNGAGKQTLNGDITAVNMYNKAGTLILGTAGNDLKINSNVLIKADGGAVQVDGNLIVDSGIFYPGGSWTTGNGTITLKDGTQMRVGGTMGLTKGITLDGGKLFNDGDHNGKDATVSSPIYVKSDSQLQSGWSGSLTLTGGLSGSGNLTVVDDSGITYFKGTGSGNYTGSLTIIGNVRIGDTNTAAVDASTYIGKGDIILKSASSTQGVFMNNSSFLTFANNLNLAGDSYLQSGWSKDMTFTGNIKGSGRFEVLTDSGWIIMGTHSTNNEFTGDVQTNYKDSTHYGQLRLAADQPFGANAGTAYIYGKLDMNGFSQTFKGLSNDGDKQSIFNDSTTLSTLTLDTTGKDLTFQSSITGNIALVVKGTGKQTLSKAPEYTGSTTVQSGTLVLSKGGKLYNLSGAGNISYGANDLQLFNTADTIYSGTLTGSGKVTFQNGTNWIEMAKTADNSFTGDVQLNYNSSTLEQGRVRLGADNALGTANRAFIYGTLDMNGYDQSFAGLSNDGNKGSIFNDTETLSTLTIDNISQDLTFHSSIAGNVALVLTGTETGKLTLKKAPEYTGSTTIEAGTLALSEGGTLYNLSGGDVDEGSDVIAFIDASGQALTLNNDKTTKFTGSIKASEVTKSGDGTLQICTAANGSIDVERMIVSSGRLDIKDCLKGSLRVQNKAVLSPGNSVGKLTVDGTFILDSGAMLLLEQDDDGIDQLTASRIEIDPDAVLELTYSSAQVGEMYNIIIQKNGDTAVNFADEYATDAFWNSLLSPESDYYWNLTVKDNVVYAMVDANAVPEPSTWALLILGAVGLMYWRRK